MPRRNTEAEETQGAENVQMDEEKEGGDVKIMEVMENQNKKITKKSVENSKCIEKSKLEEENYSIFYEVTQKKTTHKKGLRRRVVKSEKVAWHNKHNVLNDGDEQENEREYKKNNSELKNKEN